MENFYKRYTNRRTGLRLTAFISLTSLRFRTLVNDGRTVYGERRYNA
jgi:hypothetical protein